MAKEIDGNELTLTAGGALTQHVRVVISGTTLAAAGAADVEIGTVTRATFASGDEVAVRHRKAAGTTKMIASQSISVFANVYGDADGKVTDVSNENFIGVALQAASGDNSVIEVLRMDAEAGNAPLGAIDENVVIDDDFLGDYPANTTALDGHGPVSWTKVETNGLGVVSSDEANGVLIFAFDNAVEAATAALYLVNAPIDIDQSPIFDFRVAVFDIGDAAALDINIGFADNTHATDFDATTINCAFHLDGADLSVLCQSDDDDTVVAAVDTTVDLVDDTYANLRIDATDKTDIRFYINGTRVAAGSTFTMANYSGAVTPIVHVEKTSDDTTADVRVDRIRVQSQRN